MCVDVLRKRSEINVEVPEGECCEGRNRIGKKPECPMKEINTFPINLNPISTQIILYLQKLHNTFMFAEWCLAIKCGIQLEKHLRCPTLACHGG